MLKFLRKYWPVTGIIVVLVVMSYYVIRARHEIAKGSILSAITVNEGLKLDNIHYVQNNPDQGVKWTLDAKEVKFSKDLQHIFFKDFKLKLEPDSKPSIELDGKGGDYDKTTSEMNLRGDLHGLTDNGYRLITEHILYSQKDGYLKTKEQFEIIGPFFSVKGQGLYFDLEKEILKAKSDVTTLITGNSLIL